MSRCARLVVHTAIVLAVSSSTSIDCPHLIAHDCCSSCPGNWNPSDPSRPFLLHSTPSFFFPFALSLFRSSPPLLALPSHSSTATPVPRLVRLQPHPFSTLREFSHPHANSLHSSRCCRCCQSTPAAHNSPPPHNAHTPNTRAWCFVMPVRVSQQQPTSNNLSNSSHTTTTTTTTTTTYSLRRDSPASSRGDDSSTSSISLGMNGHRGRGKKEGGLSNNVASPAADGRQRKRLHKTNPEPHNLPRSKPSLREPPPKTQRAQRHEQKPMSSKTLQFPNSSS